MAESDKKSVRVTIYNQQYTLSTSGDPAEVEELARSVDDLMRHIAARAGNIDSARVAVLACLHIADEQRTLQRELSEMKQRLDSKHRDLKLILDQVVGEAE